MLKRYKIQFPKAYTKKLDQDKAYFFLYLNKKKIKIKFHDYSQIYSYPGLYEQLFYDRLKCNSPMVVTEALKKTIDQNKEHFSEQKVLDLGAGNGLMGEALKKTGVARLIGIDILNEAKEATERDRPGVYDEYYVKDFTKLKKQEIEEIQAWGLNSMISVAALGFGDIPPKAFIQALNLISEEGWIAFNIKETFLNETDTSGFSKTIRHLIFSEYLFINHLKRYRHRISIDGQPLYYFSVVCWKQKDIPNNFLKNIKA